MSDATTTGASPPRDEGPRGVFETFTLKGFLDWRRVQRNGAAANGTHHEETYKLFAADGAVQARLRKLPERLLTVVDKAIVEFGGAVPRALYERLAFPEPWGGGEWREALESRFLGTVAPLDLTRFGIHANDETLVLFHEVVLARLRALGDERPVAVASEVVMGVDLASDLARFLAFLGEDHVRFTVHGELFKTSERRLVDQFVPGCDPRSKEPSRQEVLDFIYRFALSEGLIARTGERTYAVSERGRAWEKRPLDEKHPDLLRFALDERGLPGEPLHQAGLRRRLLKFLKRCTPERWYDAMYVPFVARNAYLSGLERLPIAEFLAARHGDAHAAEDLQQMGWHLLGWVRRRLALLGVVDLGLDAVGRPVAIRLSRLGARLLGVLGTESPIHEGQSHLVVNPSFEIVLLPEGEEFEIVHALDRFCLRVRHELLYHYEITEESVRRGLRDGMSLSAMFGWLGRYARAPIPQNVVFSMREWGARAGVVALDGAAIRGERPEVLDRIAADARLSEIVAGRPSPTELALAPGFARDRVERAIAELGLFLDAP
ncbi:MAG TPA: helicase-associated domain-containing protein [Planctomycetota bacterium]|nr:helicase-associated domain-containing protein [Planctomycetota bacterium]